MSDIPTVGLPLTIWTCSPYGVGVGAREIAAGSSQLVSTAWTTANLAIFTPIFLPFTYPVRNLFVYNFATVNGTVDVGIYNADLTKVVGSTNPSQTGASTLQFFAVDAILLPGQYYLAMSSSSTTGTYACCPIGTATRNRYLGLFQMATANPLPATATITAVANARVPAIGFTFLTGTPNF